MRSDLPETWPLQEGRYEIGSLEFLNILMRTASGRLLPMGMAWISPL